MRHLLAELGYAAQVRMIDGELALADEEPPDTWRELRVGAPEGMITLRRSAEGMSFVTWGNADASLRRAWNALTWAFAEAGGGVVHSPQGAVDAPTFRRSADMPEALRMG